MTSSIERASELSRRYCVRAPLFFEAPLFYRRGPTSRHGQVQQELQEELCHGPSIATVLVPNYYSPGNHATLQSEYDPRRGFGFLDRRRRLLRVNG